ncbi:HAL/PAL/TAL family ammonia-lyase [Bacillus atrophaeus]|uniref:HAL/PAL/TAL family ammonia-lyase n=1 Tax=Bacillus atrophaeus TaxID=1452 RepID=UPI001C62B2FB|nr:aromatic amino acid ammonia-lyase [Bacillus atrophaeus]MED4805247.1 aromatic amino acid ammonia-lyase [Bacillus atrophaeus]MED4816120.1 aromatic amino acid ammonia-lyase [Bacillus atrophaeus]MED4822945.1 aromatic amino acid ammonia-lyase [Bacillus atrophaeus]MED4842495.1 aromatic amino acid ammonia-lyase [Bacillus atrophaeus]QYG89210.1 aromatic amino acid lyase [Bacillus atrophaeus]
MENITILEKEKVQIQYQEKGVTLNGNNLTIEDVVSIAKNINKSFTFKVSEEALKNIEESNQLKHEIINEQKPIYGVTTGFGDSVIRQISPEKTLDLQRNLIKFLSCGVGPNAELSVARATMIIRSNCLIKGNSAVRFKVIEQLLTYLERGITPIIPERGSVGASGDLVPLSYLASIITGEGKVLYQGRVCEVREALEAEELIPIKLEAKEGLALVNGTSFMSAFACLAYSDAEEIAFLADICTAMASEALLGNRGHFYSFIHEQKPHPGQMKSAKNIYDLLEGSQLSKEYSQIITTNKKIESRSYVELTQSIQERYSIRCAPHVIGVLYDTLTWVKQWLEIEINSTNDNPIFDNFTREVYNGGNFYGGHVAQAMDSLKVAVANIADLLDRQLQLIVDEKFNKNLTPNLIQQYEPNDYELGLHHGFKGMQIACSALAAEALKMSNPVSVFSRSTEAHNQDKVSMGTIASRDARTIVELTQQVTAIHLIALCQALDLRGKEKMSPQTATIYQIIREKTRFVDQDRPLDSDIQAIVQLIQSGELKKAILNLKR